MSDSPSFSPACLRSRVASQQLRASYFAEVQKNYELLVDVLMSLHKQLARQLLGAGTPIGANVEEAQAGQSKADFISKNAIALKEARETHYWLRLLAATEVLPRTQISGLLTEADEVMRIIGANIVSAKRPK